MVCRDINLEIEICTKLVLFLQTRPSRRGIKVKNSFVSWSNKEAVVWDYIKYYNAKTAGVYHVQKGLPVPVMSQNELVLQPEPVF